jgi:hypothetical protein
MAGRRAGGPGGPHVTAVASPEELLAAALAAGAVPRPLVAPLASAAAGELEALPPRTILSDPTKLANLVRDLTLSLGADVAVAEFGTFWDAEAAGAPLDWSGGTPCPAPAARPSGGALDLAAGRGPVVLEVVRRLRAMLAGRALVAAGVTGPVRLAGLFGRHDAADAVDATLAAVRALCDAGAQVIWLVEGPSGPHDPDALVAALAPVWGTIRFYRALGVLHLADASETWRDVIARGGPYVPCFDPDAAPALTDAIAGTPAIYGLALPPGRPGPRALELARDRRCALLTHDGELAGRVPGRELSAAAQQLRATAA